MSGAVTPRVRGVDVARGVALLGMMSVHLLPEYGADGHVQPAFLLASGRAAALFALLAGVGLALVTGGDQPRLRPRRAVVASVVTRALLVGALGMALVQLDPPVAVILTNYGVLFVVALPFLALRPRQLLVIAAGWVLVTPVLSHALRSGRPYGPGEQLSFAGLAHPGDLAERLLLTGYYPVLTWTAYLLVGLAIGRMPLRRKGIGISLATGGAGLALVAAGVSALLVGAAGWERVVAAGPGTVVLRALGPGQLQVRGLFGTTPTTTWWWETIISPHSGTVFDLAQTTGSAVAVLGVALLVAERLDGLAASRLRSPAVRLVRGVVGALAATGSMTLTLYSLHVVAASTDIGPRDREQLLLVHVVVAVLAASLWRARAPRGPLEQVVRWSTQAARRLVSAKTG